MRLHLVLILSVALLGGCSFTERFDSVENRVNGALPPDGGVQSARQRLLAQVSDSPEAGKSMEIAWAARLRLRASTCSRDYTPSWRDSTEDIRARLAGSRCFGDFDRSLQRWLGLQRVRLLLTQGPIRPVPQDLPKLIVHREFISTFSPAAEAAVAIVRGTTRLDVLDLSNGKSLFGEPAGRADTAYSISSNGRVFAQAGAGKVWLRATDGGETLVELQQADGLLWLGNEAFGLRGNDGGPSRLRLLDLATGDETPVQLGEAIAPYMAVRAPGTAPRFNLLGGHRSVWQIELVRVGDRLEAQVRAEKRHTGAGFAVNTGGLTADGSTWVDGHQGFRLLDMDTLAMEERSFAPVGTQTAWPLQNADEVLLSMHLPTGNGITSHFNYYVYSRRAGTLAPLQREPNASLRFHYIPALKRLAVIDEQTLRYVDTLPVGTAEPAASVVNGFVEEMNQRRLASAAAAAAAADAQAAAWGPAQAAQAAARAAVEAARGAGQSPPPAPVFGGSGGSAAPMLPGLRDVAVEGVGVYEGAGARHGVGLPRSPGSVEVIVRRSTRPVVLVLTSYEPVRWRITLMPGAQLAAVLQGGYYESTVIGAGNVRVVNIGQSYAYAQNGPGYEDVQRSVVRWVGRPITFFQGRYEAGSFTVGGS